MAGKSEGAAVNERKLHVFHPDIRTLVLVANLVALSMAAIFAVLTWFHRGSERPILLWTVAFLSRALAFFLIYVRSQVPNVLSFQVANILFVGSTQLFLWGLLAFRGTPLDKRRQAAIALLSAAAVFLLFDLGSYGLAISGVLLMIALVEAVGVGILLRQPRRGMASIQRISAAILGVDVLMQVYRLPGLLAGTETSSPFAPDPISTVFFLEVILFHILWGTALLALLYRRAHVAELEIIAQLQQALADVRTLEGMLPICAWCKRIRDEDEVWLPVEKYVAARTDARFSHSICPDCAAQFKLSAPWVARPEPGREEPGADPAVNRTP